MRVTKNGLLLGIRAAKPLEARARRCAVAMCAVALVFSLGGCASSAASAAASSAATSGAAASGAATSVSTRVISAAEGRELMASSPDFLLIDVREQYEYTQGHIEGAVCIPYTQLEANRDKLPADARSTIVVYCRSGNRSATAAKTLMSIGYTNVLDMGGIIDWPYEVVAGDAAQVQSDAPAAADSSAAASSDAAADHEHQFEPLDCNYQKCTVCGYEERY